ncbi:MAG TPA: polysaccharide deacetylase family protein [Steroidobacteraceae bacterium]|nr:polysaccharide deacetylase family protein [Steroidobacteraceae bacterium]
MSRSSALHRWLPSPLLKTSALVHVAAAGSLVRPELWPWALGAVIGNHLLLAGGGLWPRSRLLGPNWTRLPAAATAQDRVAITIDDGPDPEVTPRVLARLEERAAKATFFCIGQRIARYPDLAREIVLRGHAIENHTQRHRNSFALLGPRAIAREIIEAQEAIRLASGSRPVFFRAPAGLRNPFLEPVLARLGLRLASWTRRGFDTVNRDPAVVLTKLRRGLRGGDILLLHDGRAARTASGAPVILEVLPRVLDACTAAALTPITLRAALKLDEGRVL